MNPDGSDQQPLPISAHGNSPVWSPDGQRIAFTSNRDGDDDIWKMNADGSDQQNLTRIEAWDDQPQWAPDGAHISFTSDRDGIPNIYIMNLERGDVFRLVIDSTLNMAFATWSPDGNKLLFHAALLTD